MNYHSPQLGCPRCQLLDEAKHLGWPCEFRITSLKRTTHQMTCALKLAPDIGEPELGWFRTTDPNAGYDRNVTLILVVRSWKGPSGDLPLCTPQAAGRVAKLRLFENTSFLKKLSNESHEARQFLRVGNPLTGLLDDLLTQRLRERAHVATTVCRSNRFRHDEPLMSP
jgi:hypothetical protein